MPNPPSDWSAGSARNEQIVDFFDTASDAVTAGGHLYEDGEFSVQEVMRAPINLGYFSFSFGDCINASFFCLAQT